MIHSFEYIFAISSNKFSAYQIFMLLEHLREATSGTATIQVGSHPRCVGPGMIPSCSVMMQSVLGTEHLVGGDEIVEPGLDEKSEDDNGDILLAQEPAAKKLKLGEYNSKLDNIGVKSSYPRTALRQAFSLVIVWRGCYLHRHSWAHVASCAIVT
jgi:hypothetical protein